MKGGGHLNLPAGDYHPDFEQACMGRPYSNSRPHPSNKELEGVGLAETTNWNCSVYKVSILNRRRLISAFSLFFKLSSALKLYKAGYESIGKCLPRNPRIIANHR